MADLNPRQFASLDYADADLYQGLNQRTPPAAVPFNLPLPDLGAIAGSQEKVDASRLATARSELARQKELDRPQREAQAQREADLQQRQQSWRNQMAEKYPSMYGGDTPQSDTAKGYDSLYKPKPSSSSSAPSISTGSPPPTLNNTAARASALVEPTATPRSVGLAEAVPTVAAGAAGTLGAAAQSIPRSLPQAAGRLAVPGVFVAADFGSRVISGQPVGQAAGSALITGGTSAIGLAIGSAFGGPIGGAIGSVVGGFIGQKVGSLIFGDKPSSTAHLESNPLNYPPFIGGQNPNAIYRVTGTYDLFLGNTLTGTYTDTSSEIKGPIGTPRLYQNENGQAGWGFIFPCVDSDAGKLFNIVARGGPGGTRSANLRNVSVQYIRGGGGESPVNLLSPAPPLDNTPSSLNTSPIGNDNTIPSGSPMAGNNKGKDKQVSPSTPNNNRPNGAPFFPGHSGLAPSYLPNPTQIPSNGGGMLPNYERLPDPRPFAKPEDYAVPRANTSGTTKFYTDLVPTPTPVPQPVKPIPFSDGNSPLPKSQSYAIPKTDTEAQKEKDDKKIKDLNDEVTKLGIAIAAITPLINKIPSDIAKSPDVRAANKDDIQGAVCEIAQPQGCLGSPIKKAEDAAKANGSKLDGLKDKIDALNLGANAAQLALLELINTKLGDLIPGGLSGKLQRLSSWLHLDRVLNILIWWQTLHNAYMLSANLGQTLTSAISNVLAAIGIKDAEGSPLDIGEILGNQFDSLAKSVIGETEWGSIKAEYKKWNRIYQAAANLMNSIQSIGYSILSALEVVGSWVASIGNALRQWGEVSEKAYRWMNPTPNFQNKFFTALETTENVVSQIDSVASEVLSVQETVTQIGEQKNIIEKALREDDNSKQGAVPPEATKVKGTNEEAKQKSTTPQLPQISSDADKEADE